VSEELALALLNVVQLLLLAYLALDRRYGANRPSITRRVNRRG